MDRGWLKLWRKLDGNEIIRDSLALQVFVYLLIIVDKETGIKEIGRFWVSDALQMNSNTFYKVLKRLEKKYQVITTSSNNKTTKISLLNWDKYQGSTATVTTKQQQSNTKVTHYKNKKETNTNVLVKKEVPVTEKTLDMTPAYLVNIPLEDMPLLKKDTSATYQQIKSKGEDLHNWLLSKGKQAQYKDFKALLRNAIKRDYPASEVLPTYDELKAKGLTW